MTFAEVMKQLESMGTAQNRKIYARHGVPADKMFGVSYANLYALQKKFDAKLDVPSNFSRTSRMGFYAFRNGFR